MPEPIKLKPLHCNSLSISASVKRSEFRLAELLDKLAKAFPTKRGLKRLPIFIPIEPSTRDTDCHLHFSVERGSNAEEIDIELSLHAISGANRTRPHDEIQLENIGSWLGGYLQDDLEGIGSAVLEYSGDQFSPVIPLPYAGIQPFKSAIIRKSKITGIEITVDESDIGLTRFLLYKPKENNILLHTIFAVSNAVNYSMFVKMAERVGVAGSVLVTKAGVK